MRFFYYIIIFIFSFCGNFFTKNFTENLQVSAQSGEVVQNFTPHLTPLSENILWHQLQTGQFVPMSFLSSKQPIISSKIWKDDDSILRYVGPDFSLSDRNYRPSDLVAMSGANINEAGRVSQIRAIAKPSILAIAKDFQKDFSEPLIAISAFRSAEYQQRLWDLGRCEGGAFCSKPGHSEHQLGLGVDFFDATSETQYLTNPRYKSFYHWMKKNAYKYGWTQSYKH